MARGVETKKFIAEGLFRYAAARATVLSFEEAVGEEVSAIVASDAAPLAKGRAKPKVSSPSVCNGDAGGRVACCQFRGNFGRETVTWELGIWWQDPSQGNDVVVYAECVEGPRHLTQKEWATVPKVHGQAWSVYRGGINLALEPKGDLTEAFKRLIREVAKQARITTR